MENRIPQDITGFKFKLIGSITIKQFLYLLAGGALALIIYLFQRIAIKLPFMLTFFGIGASLAFLPIEGRPMDAVFVNFIRAPPLKISTSIKKGGLILRTTPFYSRLNQLQKLRKVRRQKMIATQKERFS